MEFLQGFFQGFHQIFQKMPRMSSLRKLLNAVFEFNSNSSKMSTTIVSLQKKNLPIISLRILHELLHCFLTEFLWNSPRKPFKIVQCIPPEITSRITSEIPATFSRILFFRNTSMKFLRNSSYDFFRHSSFPPSLSYSSKNSFVQYFTRSIRNILIDSFENFSNDFLSNQVYKTIIL